MPSIKKSELEALRATAYQEGIWEKRYNAEKQWKNYYRDWLYDYSKEAGEAKRTLQEKLTIENENVGQLKDLLAQAESRLTERNQTVAKFLHNGINLAAEHRKQQQVAIDYCVEAFGWRDKYIKLLVERDNLRSELALQKEIPKMVEQVVHYVNEWNPGTFYATKEPDPIPANPPQTKSYARLAVALLIGATIGLTILCAYEAKIIHNQRELILGLWRFIQAGCPFTG
jgi:hypothetical protein